MKSLKIIGYILLVLLLVVAGGAYYIWRSAPTQAERAAVYYLGKMGIAPVSLKIDSINQNSIVINHFSVGEPEILSADDVKFSYDLRTIKDTQKIGAVRIKTASVHLYEKAEKFWFGSLDGLVNAPKKSEDGDVFIPAPSVDIETLDVMYSAEKAEDKFLRLHHVSLVQKVDDAKVLTLKIDKIEDLSQTPAIKMPVRLFTEIQLKHPMEWKGLVQGSKQQLTLNFYGKGDDNYLENTKARVDIRSMPIQYVVLLAMQEGVTVTGNFSGSLPVSFKKNHIVIDNAAFAAKDKGIIQYAKADETLGAGGESAAMVSTALKNFHYQLLSFSVKTVSPGRTEIKATINGANPDLYEGKPINLNLTIGGDLEAIVKKQMEVYGLPQQIQQKVGGK